MDELTDPCYVKKLLKIYFIVPKKNYKRNYSNHLRKPLKNPDIFQKIRIFPTMNK